MLILGWFILHSLLRKEYWWSRFNVAGGLFYGPEVYHSGLGRATLSGAAVLLLYYCLAGMVFGWLADPASRLRTLLRAALSAGLLHAFASFCLWPAMALAMPRPWRPGAAAAACPGVTTQTHMPTRRCAS